MAEITTRRGVVLNVEQEQLTVRVSGDCHCDGCAIVAFCGSKNDDDNVTLHTPDAFKFKPGDMIQFEPSTGAQWNGILLAFGVPILIIAVAMLATLGAGYSELIAALAAALGCGLYFIIMGTFFRHRLETAMNWKITRLNNSENK